VSFLAIHELRKAIDALIWYTVSSILLLMCFSLSQFHILLLLFLLLYLNLWLVLEIWRKELYLDHCRSIPDVLRMFSTSLPNNPLFTVATHAPHSAPLPTNHPLPTVKIDIAAPSNLDFSIAL